jgi:hypothetical protein
VERGRVGTGAAAAADDLPDEADEVGGRNEGEDGRGEDQRIERGVHRLVRLRKNALHEAGVVRYV